MRSSERKHWDRFWEASEELNDVYGTDARIVANLEPAMSFADKFVLEVGAGTGRDAAAIAAQGAHVVALDYSESSLALMGRTVEGSVELVSGDALALPFRDGVFDLVYHQGLLEHFRAPGALLDENVRVLKPGGLLLVDVPQRYHYYTVLKHILISVGKWFAGWETEFSARELRGLLEARGLTVVGMYGHNMKPPIWYRGLRRVLLGAGLRLPMYPRGPRLVERVWSGLASRVPETVFINTAMVIGCIARKP